jgi:hypothetical protein
MSRTPVDVRPSVGATEALRAAKESLEALKRVVEPPKDETPIPHNGLKLLDGGKSDT